LSDSSASPEDEVEAQPFVLKNYTGQQAKLAQPSLDLPRALLQSSRVEAQSHSSSAPDNGIAASFSRLKQALAALDREFRSNPNPPG